jgi:uncharacterized protein (TIGR03067 family)
MSTRCLLALFVVLPCAWLYGPAARAQGDRDFNLSEARLGVVFIERVTPGLPPAYGSGFLVSKDGLVYTNRHVVRPQRGSARGSVLLVGVPKAKDPDSLDYFRAEELTSAPSDTALDFSVLKVAAGPGYGDFRPLPLSEGEVDLGTSVAALGYPRPRNGKPVLSFNKGSISAPRVELDGHRYFQTDAAVNPGSSGGPLINRRGETVGIVTSRDAGAQNIGFALYLRETKTVAAAARARLSAVKPPAGPLDTNALPTPRVIAPRRADWLAGSGLLRQEGGELIIDAQGGHYWLTSKEILPEDFQLVIPCQVEFLQGRQQLRLSQRSVLRTFCVRFGTDETDHDILERTGYLIRFNHSGLHLGKDGEDLKAARRGITGDPFILTVTKQRGTVTVAVDDEIVLEHHDPRPLTGRHRFSIGGYLSRLHLSGVSVIDLGGGAAPGTSGPREEAVSARRPGRLPASGSGSTDGSAAALEELQGNWKVYREETSRGIDATGGSGMRIEGDRVQFWWGGGSGVGPTARLTVDPTKEPREIDLTYTSGHRGKKQLGIYRVSGRELQFSWSGIGAPRRPRKFTGQLFPGAGEQFVILRREDYQEPAALAAERKRLEGRWEVVGKPSDGVLIEDDGMRFLWGGNNTAAEAKFTPDPVKEPRWIELIYTVGTQRYKRQVGIYKLDGDRLTLSLGELADDKRPTQFAPASHPGGGKIFVVYARVPEK